MKRYSYLSTQQYKHQSNCCYNFKHDEYVTNTQSHM